MFSVLVGIGAVAAKAAVNFLNAKAAREGAAAAERGLQKVEQERNTDRVLYERRITDLAHSMQKAEERHKELIAGLADSMQEAEERMKDLAQQLEKPIRDRQEKLSFVNGLKLDIRQTDSLLLVGPKGMGKSTFLWLLNKGDTPKRTIRDGTVEMIHRNGFVDTIGLRGWTPEELLKVLVLMIYDGIPKDLIIFANDRVDLPVSSLGLLGINNPMIVILSSDFWKHYLAPAGDRKKINLVQIDGGVRRVQPDKDLDMVYNLPVYEEIKQFHLGTPVTHHDNLELLVEKRENAGIQPFQFLLEKLGTHFTASMENEFNMEALFRFVYIYEKKYEKNRLKFMNQATLRDFA